MEEQPKSKSERRDFLKTIFQGGLLAFLGVTIYPIVSFLKPPKQEEVEVKSVSVGKLGDFKVGDSKLVRFGNKPVIVILAEEGKYTALSATCTHLDCTVQYKNDEKVIWCACHNGKYNLHGKNISGPPPKPLDKYFVSIKNEEIIVSKEA